MEIALYARVSTNRQQQNQTIEQQIERLKAKIEKQQDWHLSENHIYRDDGYSGASLNRPGLDRLRDHASLSCFELVVITEPDRLARKYVHQMLLIEELTDVGCKVEFLDRPMSENPHDHLLLQIRGAVAEYERNLIAERMRRGRQMKLKNGQLLPWTIAPYGYILDPERPRDPNRVQIDPVKSQVVKQIFDCYTDPQRSISIYGLARQLSEKGIVPPKGGSYWSTATVRRILCSPSYTGTAYSGRTQPAPACKRKSALQPVGTRPSYRPTPSDQWIAVKVPAIISQEVFDMAQTRLEQNKQMSRRNNSAHNYLLRGLVSCGRCQLSCTGRFVNSGYPYYVCNRHTDAFHVVNAPETYLCSSPGGAISFIRIDIQP